MSEIYLPYIFILLSQILRKFAVQYHINFPKSLVKEVRKKFNKWVNRDLPTNVRATGRLEILVLTPPHKEQQEEACLPVRRPARVLFSASHITFKE